MTAVSTTIGSQPKVPPGAGHRGGCVTLVRQRHRRRDTARSCARETAAVLALLALTLARPVAASIDFEGFSYPVGENPKGISVSDCNGDGSLDLIVANQNSTDLTILRNTGSGKYEFGNTISSVVTQPIAAVCRDFTGDGLIDIAVLSRDMASVAFYRLRESGGFAVLGSVRVASNRYSAGLASGDLNADGLPDLVVVNHRSNILAVLYGTGSDALPALSTIHLPVETPDAPVAVAIADFNGDSEPDIALASSHQPYLTVLIRDGVGFRPLSSEVPSPFVNVRRPPRGRAVAAADLNNDGFADLALLSTQGTVTLYLGGPSESFTFHSVFVATPHAGGIALADVNNDGRTDMMLVDDVGNSVQVLPATGPLEFGPPGAFPASEVVSSPDAEGPVPRTALLEPEDSNEGATELLYLNRKASALEVMTAQDPGGLAVTPLRVFPKGEKPRQLLLVDLNNDMLPDAVVTKKTRNGMQLDVRLGNETGGFDEPPRAAQTCGNFIIEGSELCDDANQVAGDGCSPTCMPEIGRSLTGMEAIDLDADGNQDVVISNTRGQVLLLLGDGQGRFLDVRLIATVRRRSPVVVADFNGDDLADIAATEHGHGKSGFAIFVNDGLGNFAPAPALGEPTAPQPKGPLLAGDFDRNGFVDFAYAVKVGNGWTILYNEGVGPAVSSDIIPTPKRPVALAAADFNEDGWLDIVATFGKRKASALMFAGVDGRSFGAGQAVLPAERLEHARVVDMNDDLHHDIVACGGAASSTCNLHYGDGTGRFSPSVPALSRRQAEGSVGRQIRDVAAADLDGDGTVDLVGVSRRDHRVVVLFRNPGSPDTTRMVLTGGLRPRVVAIADLNGDARPDLIVGNEASKDLSVFLNIGNRLFESRPAVRLPERGGILTGMAVGDMDGNGAPDVVVSQNASSEMGPNVAVLLNDGSAGFSTTTMAAGGGPRHVTLGDLNGDGALDIIVANSSDHTLTLLLSQAGGSYTRSDIASGGLQPSAVAAADVNGDGLTDLIVVNKRAVTLDSKVGSVVVFLNDGAAGFSEPASVHVRGREVPSAVCTGDFDEDGSLDVAVGGSRTNDIMVLRGRGDGTWQRNEQLYPIFQGSRSLYCTDVDLDGRPDVVFSGRRGGEIGWLSTAS